MLMLLPLSLPLSRRPTPALGVDESFVLNLTSSGGADGTAACTIDAPTAFGALYGLEAFSQLLRRAPAAEAEP